MYPFNDLAVLINFNHENYLRIFTPVLFTLKTLEKVSHLHAFGRDKACHGNRLRWLLWTSVIDRNQRQ